MATHRTASAIFAAAALALAACKPETGGPAASQVAARVNGSEISVRQVMRIVQQPDGDVAPQKVRQATTRALEHLIDQELLVQKALDARLDQEPTVLEAIAAERRRILGLAWLDRNVPRAPARSPDEVRHFYYANPALFERRRVYETRELILAAFEEKESLRARVAQAARIDEVAAWLRARGVPFRETTATRPAEQIPLEVLPRLNEMKDGQIALLSLADELSVLQLIGTSKAPLGEAQAAPVIERMLDTRWRLESAMNEVKRLREAARIEYVAPFDPGMRLPIGSPGAGKFRLTMDQPLRRRSPDRL